MRWKAVLLFVTCALLLLMSLFYRVSTAIIAPVLSSDLSLTPHDLGLLGGSFFYCFAVTQLPLGVFIDRIGARRTMIFMNGLAVLGALVFAGSESLFYAVLGRSLLGIGMAGNLMGPLQSFSRSGIGRKNSPPLSGILLAAASLGNLAASSPLAVLVQFLGWRLTFNLLGGVNLLLIFPPPLRAGSSRGVGKDPPCGADEPGMVAQLQDALHQLELLGHRPSACFSATGRSPPFRACGPGRF